MRLFSKAITFRGALVIVTASPDRAGRLVCQAWERGPVGSHRVKMALPGLQGYWGPVEARAFDSPHPPGSKARVGAAQAHRAAALAAAYAAILQAFPGAAWGAWGEGRITARAGRKA